MKPRRAARWLAWAFALTLIGYPLAGLAAVFTGLPSWSTSYPFRFVVVAMSAWLLIRTARMRPSGALPAVLAMFWVLYVGRLLFDTVAGPPGAFEALFFFTLTTLIPLLALVRLAPHWDDALAAHSVFILGTAICTGGVLIGTGVIATDRQLDITTRLFLDTVNPVTFGHAAVSTLIAAGTLMYVRPRSVPVPLLAAGAAAALGCLVLAGSRGPVLALAMCALAVALVRRRIGLLLAVAVVMVGVLLVTSGDGEVATRFQGLETLEGDASALERLVLQANAIEIFLANPVLGGAFAEFEINAYPHNIFIETAMALGAVGLTLLLVLLLGTFGRCFERMRRHHVLLPLLFLQYFVGFQFSGALWGSSAFWACMALLLSRRRARRRASGPLPLQAQPAPAT
jgi:hypothetical protein